MLRLRGLVQPSRSSLLQLLAFAATATALMQAILWNPLALGVPILLGLGLVGLRHPERAALACLLIGPILLSTITIGPLTADNLVTFAGLGFAIVAALVRGSIPFTALSVLPLSMGLAVCASLVLNTLPFGADMVRFAAIGVVPFVAGSAAVSSDYFRRITLGVISIGGLSILVQPIIGFPAPYMDTETELLRNGGLFGHPNFGAYCLGIGLLVVVLQRRMAITDVLIAITLAAPLLLSGARTASAVTALIAFFFLLTRLKRLVVSLSAGLVLVFGAGSALTSRLESLGSDGLGSSGALLWRITQWEQALDLLEGNAAWGVGRNQIQNTLSNGLGAHSGYVTLIVETGLIGSTIIGLGFVVAFTAYAGRWSQGIAAVWIFALLTSVTDPVLLYPSTLTLLVVLSTRSIERNKITDEPLVLADQGEKLQRA